MDDNQLQAWLDQHGGEVGRRDNEKDVDGEINPDTGAPTKKRVVDTTTITARDGATLTLRRSASGSGPTYSVIENTPPKPVASGSNNPASPVTGATVHIEGTPDPSKPGGFDNERPVKVVRDARGNQVGLAVPLEGKELQDWHEDRQRARNPGRKTDKEIADEKAKADSEADRKAQQNRPSVTIKEDGSGGLVSIQTYPDGRTPVVTPIQGVRGTPQQVKGPDGNTYERQPDGSYAPARGIPTDRRGGKLPPGVNPPRFSRGNVSAELNRFNRELDAAVSRGEITKEEALGFYTPYHQEASTYLQEQNYGDSQDNNAVSSALTQRSQNATVAGNRLNWSNSAFQNAAAQDNNLLMGAAGTGRSALVPLLTLQAGLANASGGFREQPEVEIRRFPAMGAPVPASIAPVINATNAAPSGVATGTKSPPLLPPNQPVGAAQASAVAAGANPQPARTGTVAPPPGVVDPRSVGAPENPVAGGATIVTVRDKQTGGVRQMRLADFNAMPDRDQYEVIDPNGTGSVTPTSQRAVNPTVEQAQPVGGATEIPTPQINMLPMPPAPSSPSPGSASKPLPAVLPHEMVPPGAPVGPATGAGGNVQMIPRSIQPAMPQPQPMPDIEAITAKMLADGVDPLDVMAVRRRWQAA